MKIAANIHKVIHSYPFKLVLAFSMIMLAMISFISIYLTRAFSNILVEKEINFENQITRRVMDYTDDTIAASKEVVKSIYLSDTDTKISVFNILGNTYDVTSFDYLKERSKFDTLFSSPLIKNNNILDVILYKKPNGEIISYSKNMRKVNESFDFHQYPWFEEVLKNDQLLRIIPSYQQTYMNGNNKLVYTVVSSIFNAFNKTSGVIMINMDTAQLEKSFAQYRNEIKGTILVLNTQGQVLYDSSNTWYGQTYPYFSLLKENGRNIQLDVASIVSLAYSDKNDLLVAGIIPKSEIDQYVGMILRTIYLVVFASIGVALVLVYFTSRLLTQRIKIVTNAMIQVEKGDLATRIPLDRSKDEIHRIALSFNRMCEELGSYINKVYVAGIRTKDAELNALQMQINPHFLYNTLEAIRMKAVINKDPDVGDMVYTLANLFKSSMKTKDMMVTIAAELDYCRSYLEIHRIRYRERLAVRFQIDDAILDYKIPKLVLQPLVENCIMYGGLQTTVETLLVTVTGFLNEAGNVVLMIEDDGVGMDEETLRKLRDRLDFGDEGAYGGGIGLANINDRIGLIFGVKYGLKIISRARCGTSIRMEIPAIGEEDADDQNTAC